MQVFKIILFISILSNLGIASATPSVDSYRKKYKIVKGAYSPTDFKPSQQRPNEFENTQSDELWKVVAANGANVANTMLKENGDVRNYLNKVIEFRQFLEPNPNYRAGILRTDSIDFRTYINSSRYWEYEERFVSEYIGENIFGNVEKDYIYTDISGNKIDAGRFRVSRHQNYRYVEIVHVQKPEPILEDVLLRFQRLLKDEFKGTKSEKIEEFYRALWGFYISCPYNRGTAAIGKIFSAGLYYKLFKEKLPYLPDGVDLEALLTTTPEEFAKRMINFKNVESVFHIKKPPYRRWYKMVPSAPGLKIIATFSNQTSIHFHIEYHGVRADLYFVKTQDSSMRFELPPNYHVRIDSPDLLKIVLELGAKASKILGAENIEIPNHLSVDSFNQKYKELLDYAILKDWGAESYNKEKKGTVYLQKGDVDYFFDTFKKFEESKSKNKCFIFYQTH